MIGRIRDTEMNTSKYKRLTGVLEGLWETKRSQSQGRSAGMEVEIVPWTHRRRVLETLDRRRR